MGGGSFILLMYGLCCGTVGFAVLAGGGLYGWGRWTERRRRARAGEPPRGPEPPPEGEPPGPSP